MTSFENKTGVIMGLANGHSIAAAIAKKLDANGASMAFSHIPDTTGKMKGRVERVTNELSGCKLVAPCDVSSDDQIDSFFKEVESTVGNIDFLVHSVAYAAADDLKGKTIDTSRAGFAQAMDISAYSLIATANRAARIMNDGGSILCLTYFGGEKVIVGYNMMGICKAALDATTRYLAYDLGSRQIRVNALSAGPVRTLAAAGIGDFKKMLDLYENGSPLRRNVTSEEVAESACYLLGNGSTAVSGEVHHVDCGYHAMGSPNEL